MTQLTRTILLLLSFAFIFSLTDAAKSLSTLDFDSHGAVCSLIKYNPSSKHQAAISLYINGIEGTDQSAFQDVKIPVLIFRYLHAANFTDLVPLDEYVRKYRTRLDKSKTPDPLPVADGKFKLSLATGYEKIDKEKIWNDYLTTISKDGSDESHVDIKLPIVESGYYCVYVAPPTDRGLSKIEIPVKFYNSYGNLSYLRYIIYSQLKYAIILGLVLAAFLIYSILKYKVGKDFSNLNNVSLISKGVIFYILLPYVGILILKLIVEGACNHYAPTDEPSFFLDFFRLGLSWCEDAFQVFLEYILLIFVMGFGVIYFHKGTSRNYRKFPTYLTKLSIRLLAITLLILTITKLLEHYTHTFTIVINDDGLNDQINTLTGIQSKSRLFYHIFSVISSFLSVAWFILTIIYYFKTKKTINSFPPIDSSSEGSSDANSRIIKSFKRSILIIFFIPFTLGVFFVIFSLIRLFKSFNGAGYTSGSDRIQNTFIFFEAQEMIVFNKKVMVPMSWLGFSNVFLTVLAIYAIWIKDNNGLIIDNQNYTEEPEFEISDDEETI